MQLPIDKVYPFAEIGQAFAHMEANKHLGKIVVTPAQYRRLAAYIRASFRDGGARYRGYAGYDAFYDANGRYDAVRTCNSWTGDALRFAGVRVGAWTPFPVTVMGWF